ncbi:hypothetical protein B6N60_00914 [Richelia sinica FACHB-800]|uniref:Uncharacterized protein n=1 Tax=Richelia sinica FACHB-800 TaxID=1357546 RepID=A0A975T689_9NOST|nr:hypothetical protein [Richelia sinica]MBD2664371.1 hypothetical protein [Richelia sinica FACHB-800]QXE22232.1 hypothetical protein B6N60_00914 [Richelia sinica FACHB-800]
MNHHCIAAIILGALRYATTHPTGIFLNLDLDIAMDRTVRTLTNTKTETGKGF